MRRARLNGPHRMPNSTPCSGKSILTITRLAPIRRAMMKTPTEAPTATRSRCIHELDRIAAAGPRRPVLQPAAVRADDAWHHYRRGRCDRAGEPGPELPEVHNRPVRGDWLEPDLCRAVAANRAERQDHQIQA